VFAEGAGRLMAKRLDIEKVRTALKNAAQNAVSGSCEVRSGRFMHRDVVKDLVSDASAIKSGVSNQGKQKH
jgi:hypothetical protein